jgi:hypothetical protein
MRCQACNVILNTQEATRKFTNSGEFVDLCNKCFNTISDDVKYTENDYEEVGDEDVDA